MRLVLYGWISHITLMGTMGEHKPCHHIKVISRGRRTGKERRRICVLVLSCCLVPYLSLSTENGPGIKCVVSKCYPGCQLLSCLHCLWGFFLFCFFTRLWWKSLTHVIYLNGIRRRRKIRITKTCHIQGNEMKMSHRYNLKKAKICCYICIRVNGERLFTFQLN